MAWIFIFPLMEEKKEEKGLHKASLSSNTSFDSP